MELFPRGLAFVLSLFLSIGNRFLKDLYFRLPDVSLVKSQVVNFVPQPRDLFFILGF